jgi:sugar (pentulose or hexulose) kinase
MSPTKTRFPSADRDRIRFISGSSRNGVNRFMFSAVNGKPLRPQRRANSSA